MKMRGHQYISMDGHFEGLGGVAHPAQKGAVIVLIDKKRLTIRPALDDMVRLRRDNEAGKAGHEREMSGKRTVVSLFYRMKSTMSLIKYGRALKNHHSVP